MVASGSKKPKMAMAIMPDLRLENGSPQTKPSEGTVGSHLDILYKEFY